MTHTDNEFISIDILKEHHFMSIIWKKPPLSNEYRNGITTIYELYKNNEGIKYMLFDCINMGAMSEADQAWSVNEWTNHYYNKKFPLRTAIILSEDIFTQLSLEGLYEKLDENDVNYTSQYFTNQEDAKNWLLKE